MSNSRLLDRPAADLSLVCRLLVARAVNLHRLLVAHGSASTARGQLARAVGSLDEAAEALMLVTGSAPRTEEASRATLSGSFTGLVNGMGIAGDLPGDDQASCLSGSSRIVPVVDFLVFLSGLRRTGVLWVDTLDETFRIELSEGEVTYASSDNPPPGSRLGEILVEQGSLTRERLDEMLEVKDELPELFGTALLRREIIDRDGLHRALVRQMQQIFQRLFAADVATYHFAAGLRVVADPDLRCNVTYLLLECAKRADETDRDALD